MGPIDRDTKYGLAQKQPLCGMCPENLLGGGLLCRSGHAEADAVSTGALRHTRRLVLQKQYLSVISHLYLGQMGL